MAGDDGAHAAHCTVDTQFRRRSRCKAKLASFHPTLNLLGWMPAVYVPASVVKGLMDSERDREYSESPDGSCRTKVCQEQKTVYFQKIQHFTPFF
jgi:hypothetical protein